MAGINLTSNKKKKKKKQKDEKDDVSSTNHDTEEESEDLTLSKSYKQKNKEKKKQKRNSDEEDLPDTDRLDRHQKKHKSKKKKRHSDENDLAGMDSVDQHHKKLKKRKRHLDEDNDAGSMDSVDQHQKKLKKRKRHLDEDNDVASMDSADSVDQHQKKHKKSKKRKRHSDELPVEDKLPDMDSTGKPKKKDKKSKHSPLSEQGPIHSFSSSPDYPMESPSYENSDDSLEPVECHSDGTMDFNENERSVEDPDYMAEKSSSESSKKKNRLSTNLPLTLTDEEAAIVHNGKISSSQSDIKSYKQMGINIRVGKWTPQEDSVLIKNYEALKSDYALEMDNDFLLQLLFEHFISSTKADRVRVRNFRKQSNFCVQLAGNLRRLPESVLDRARKILPAWNTGPFTSKEEKTLLSLHEKYGNQWTTIGYHMNRSRNSVLDHYQVIKDGKRRKGTWTKDETDDLIAAMSEVMKTDNLLSLPHYNMPWTKIGEKIKHRSGKQCRTHWLFYLRPKLVQGGERVKQVDTTKLLREVYNLEVETECEIDWEEMLEKMPEAGTPQNLIHQWQRLKSSISGVDSMNFDQIRENLAEYYISV